MKNKKTVFITGGGTGGHIYPACAIYNALNDGGLNLFYIGNKKRLEYKICMEQNFNFLAVDVDGMPRKFSFAFVLWAFRLIFAIFKTSLHFLKYKPNAVFATGGYVSAPSLFCARIFNVPYIIHDCDSFPGLVSRHFAPHAARVSIAFESAKKYLKNENIYVNGNPVRKEFTEISKDEARKELGIDKNATVILSMGGSQGAKSINEASKALMGICENENVVLIIQTGSKNFDDFKFEARKNLIVKPYFEKMYIPLIACDLVISRAGSLSLSEIALSASPSILIPYPYAAANHQKLNADEMRGAIVIEDKNLTGELLLNTVNDLLAHDYKLHEMKNAVMQFAKPNATNEIKAQILEILEEK